MESRHRFHRDTSIASAVVGRNVLLLGKRLIKLSFIPNTRELAQAFTLSTSSRTMTPRVGPRIEFEN